MSDNLVSGRHILVTVKLYNRGLHGFIIKQIDESFLTSGERKNIAVAAVVPFIYDHVSALVVHPCYYTDSARSDKMPSALRKVTISTLEPPSWEYLLGRAGPIKEGVSDITPNIINQHFYMILKYYLPAFDRASIEEDLSQYLPLLKEMAVYAHSEQAFKNQKASISQIWFQDQKFVDSMHRNLKETRTELDRRLEEIKAWFALKQNKRASMHDWMVYFHKGEYVYREMMNDSDRQRIQQWLEDIWNGPSETQLEWTNNETGLRFTFTLNSKISAELGQGYSTFIVVDLNPILKLKDNQRYIKKTYFNIYRNAEGIWRLK